MAPSATPEAEGVRKDLRAAGARLERLRWSGRAREGKLGVASTVTRQAIATLRLFAARRTRVTLISLPWPEAGLGLPATSSTFLPGQAETWRLKVR